jgi:hypothetical protein
MQVEKAMHPFFITIILRRNRMFFKKDHSIQSNRSRSYVRSILSVVITLSLFASSVPMSTYAGIQAPPPRK